MANRQFTAGLQRPTHRHVAERGFYLLQDHLKSGSSFVNQSGDTLANNYYPYGGNRGGAFSNLTTKRCTGQYHESGLPGGEGLSYYNARWYDPQLGRFLSADTIVPGPANPQSFNRYSYGYGNPLKYIDPNGHCPSPSVPGGTGEENRAARAENGRCTALVNTILNDWDKTDYWQKKWPDKAAFKKYLGDSPLHDYDFFLPYWMESLAYEKQWNAAHPSTPCAGCSGKIESDLADYVGVTYGAGFAPGVGISEVSIIVDQYWNVYIRLASSVNTRGFSASVGDVFINTSPDGNFFGQRTDVDSLSVSEAEKVQLLKGALTGHSASASGTWWVGPGGSYGLQAPYNVTAEAVIGAPGLAVSPWSYTFLILEAR